MDSPSGVAAYRATRKALELAEGVSEKEEPERAFREDLGRFPRNGWSLAGLAEALEGQGRTAEAEEVRSRYREAWATADVARR